MNRFFCLFVLQNIFILRSLMVVFLLSGAAVAASKPWYQETRESKAGEFTATLDSGSSTPSINEYHNWILSITHTATGESVSPARISVGGGMPMHGHGLPTQPQVTEYLGDGKYQLEGINFNMLGQWILEFEIVTASATDRVVFEIVLDI